MPSTLAKHREHIYLGLAILGFAVTGGYTVWQSVLTGNILFWTNPTRTTAELLANGTSTAFALDLALVVLVAFIWMSHEARRVGIPRGVALLGGGTALRAGGPPPALSLCPRATAADRTGVTR